MEGNKSMQREKIDRPMKRGPEQNSLSPPLAKCPFMSCSSLKTLHSLYQGSFPFYRLPSEVGHFSLDENRQYHQDNRKLRYYSPPVGIREKGSPGWNVMDGYESHYVRRNEDEKEGLLHILTWLEKNRGVLGAHVEGGSKRPIDRDFVTWRGHLTKILCTPYETQEGWLLAVTLFKGTFYISEQETEAAQKKRKERSLEQERLMYSGYKFESYICADSPDRQPSQSAVVNTNEGFCSVLLARLTSHSLLISGEVDCTDPSAKKSIPPTCYIELKSSAQIRNPHQQRSFNRYKLLKWWCQSFLLGIPIIVAGFRSPEGRIVSLETFKTSDIPHLVRGERNSWDPAVCMNFCNKFLSHIKSVVTRDDPRLVYLFAWEPGCDVTFTVHTDPEYTILPSWYVNSVN
ncbi:decapping and exoribonuclease protein [Xenopus laevis]|uniref:Decapping and exoribonuclease protein n=1 Tax=Xenopus laevis TaxID=8355 RepID=DXO_XENLA|nr:decapping and exoribonuclease protein [Xenopus laevis]Q5HZT0.1 RecName: Full=Decapping and exoribonuclease protein; Short=DXO; AltName: Full=5'-3' exoribonuclease DXO; AltName: Full=Dom-3 homolog Z; AltName: Full=NAD-capped RNA hydrolase DXO; Short=DeNADding enzyme DXO [Xenopus laevis]AAH88900.1 LOC496313 protein [Xenopus laevis]